MTGQSERDYARIERAIHFITGHYRDAPSLDDIAAAAHVSPYHFQRIFTRWAGISPKKFMQFITINHARAALRQPGNSVTAAAYDAGLSGSGRLHDLFVSIEAMTPGAFRRGGAGLTITWEIANSPFGQVVIAATPRGICHLAFVADAVDGLAGLKAAFPAACFASASSSHQDSARRIFQDDWSRLDKIRLHLRATPFQLQVWQALLRLPMGHLASYGDVAACIGAPSSARAVGTAIGQNPVAFLIPCHRVIRASGQFGDYAWGAARKTAMIGWEGARASQAHASRASSQA